MKRMRTGAISATFILSLAVTEGALAQDAAGLVHGGTLKVCTAGDFPPMQFYKNPGDTDLVGFEIDAVNAIAKGWNAKAQYLVGDFKGLLPSLGAERCELIASGILVTPERTKDYDAVSYFNSKMVLVTASTDTETKTPEDVSGKVLAIEAGSAYEKVAAELNESLVKAGKPPAQIQTYPSATGVIEQIIVGRALATITQDTTAAFRMAQMPGRLQTPYTYDGGETYGIYLRKSVDGRDQLVDAIESLQKSGEMAALLKKWSLPDAATNVDHSKN